jgi:alpha-beta hydrolase superfamily lysophospholipase
MRPNSVPRFVVAALLAAALPLFAQEETTTLGGRQVVVWHPRGAPNERHPIIVFSHGFGGCATQSRFLTEALAERGYWVFAPNHRDARCGRRSGSARPDEPFGQPEKWNDQTFIDRRDDVRAVLQAIARVSQYAGLVDLDRVGLAGHSLGGYTVVGLAGGWPSWRLPGVKAALALSPYVEPFVAHHTLGGVAAPLMYQGGTLDFGITPSVRKSGGAYESSPSPKYFVELTRAGHLAWTNLRGDAHQRILDYALPFLDHYVRGQPAAPTLTTAESGISELRYESELGTSQPAPARGRR